MNQELCSLGNEAIVDLLAQKTQRFTQLLSENIVGEEYEACKKAIDEIIVEIESRRSITLSNPLIDFQNPDTTNAR